MPLIRVQSDLYNAGWGRRRPGRPPTPRRGGLTPRELEVLALLAEGLEQKQIAARLCISVDTVKTHLANCYEALDVHTSAGAVATGIRQGLI